MEEVGINLVNIRYYSAASGRSPTGRMISLQVYEAEWEGNPEPRREIAELAWVPISELQRFYPVSDFMEELIRNHAILNRRS